MAARISSASAPEVKSRSDACSNAMPPLPDEEHMLALQYEECLSISLIYPDEFRLISGLACTAPSTDSSVGKDDQDCSSLIISTCSPDELAQPIRYSVRLRPAGDDSDTLTCAGTSSTCASNDLWPADPNFSLVVAYPPTYPPSSPSPQPYSTPPKRRRAWRR